MSIAVVALILYALLYGILAAAPQAVSGVLADRLRTVVTPAEAVSVAVEVEPPIRAAGGEFDRIAVAVASGTVMGILPVEHLAFEASPIHYDAGAAFLSREIRLRRPIDASASLVLTEEGITQLVRSEPVRARLRGLEAPRGLGPPGFGIQPRVDLVPAEVRIAEGRMELKGQVRVADLGIALPVVASVRPVLVDPAHVTFADARVSVMGRTFNAAQFGDRMAMPVIDLDGLATGDVRIRVSTLEAAAGRLRVEASAVVNRVPPGMMGP